MDMYYRIVARLKSIPRCLRFWFNNPTYYRYGSGVNYWQGWYEDNWGCLAFVDTDGRRVFAW
jgi:hypothetical protein